MAHASHRPSPRNTTSILANKGSILAGKGLIDSAQLNRRSLLRWSGGGLLLTASLSGCGLLSTDPEPANGEDGPQGQGGTDAKESPMLTEQVDAGDLPPLEERLPQEPLVVQVPEPGTYGGTFRTATTGPGDTPGFETLLGYQPPLRKNPQITETVPSICTDIVANDDGTEFTMQLRPGLRWSDGEPFTADDVLFAANDVLGNTELYPTPPSTLGFEGELAEVTKVDDATVTFTFPKPNGLFRETCTQERELVIYPKHYAKDFLPKYNKKIEQEAKENGFDAWTDYWDDRVAGDGPFVNPDLPTLFPWVIVTPLGEGNQVEFERNPYFWKTDQDGRQLPYIDKLAYEVVTDPEVTVLKTTDGEFDLIGRHINTVSNKPVFAKSREDAGYDFVSSKTTSMNTTMIALNLCHKDKKKRALYRNKDFRIGLSHAIDREELITAVWQRQGEPWQGAPSKDSIYYDEEFAKQYTEFNVDLANEHLDKAGITERDKDDFRTLPGGDQLTIIIDIAASTTPEWPPAADIIREMWKKVGIRMRPNTIDRTLYNERKDAAANDHDAGIWSGDAGLAVEMIDPRWYMPFSHESIFATPWGLWRSSQGASGEEPDGPAKEQIELFWELQRSPEPADREELLRKIIAIGKEQFWAIGIGTAPDGYSVVSNRMHNVQADCPSTWVYLTPGPSNPEAWFLDQ